MTDKPRLIEAAFPLKQASMDSVHEKSVRHGHISTLHIWPARRPLAASRAALIAALLDDPGTYEERRKLVERIGGTIVQEGDTIEENGKTIVIDEERTVGGVLHWGQETSPDIEYFRDLIRAKFGRAPRVLDPFAGGGAIPLEAMRMGCEAIAVDINPVAWFILKCTLEYPQKLAGQTLPLPDFAVRNRAFMEGFYKAQGLTKRQIENKLANLQGSDQLPGMEDSIEVDLAWHIRAWGLWVLEQVRKELEPFYPVTDSQTSVAYLWARTVKCKNCRAELPLLKTQWLAKKDKKRVLLTLEPNVDGTGVEFGVVYNPSKALEEKHHGTMSDSGATCPCCGTIMTMDDIRAEGKAQRLGAVLTSVVTEGDRTKEYRPCLPNELEAASEAHYRLEEVFQAIPFGLPNEPTPGPAGPRKNSSSLPIYGFYRWQDIFTSRQLVAIGTIIKYTRDVRIALERLDYSANWIEAISAYLTLVMSRFADRSSTICHWDVGRETIQSTFTRYALPISWDFSESNPIASSSGSYDGHLEWVARVTAHCLEAEKASPTPSVVNTSVLQYSTDDPIDFVLTDPPYYDAIMYSDIMDYFYIWLRRSLFGLSGEINDVFREPLSPKWNHTNKDGELVDDPTRFGDNSELSKKNYEDGMFRAFQNCYDMLRDNGRMVIVFANKAPDAWETLVSAIVRAGFVVTGSWPIQTEMSNRTRAMSSAALSSSIWLVCRKRSRTARPGWDNQVILEMQHNIIHQLHEFWDAGIRGPDFVWAATGPAMEAYSQYPAVKKANDPGSLLTVPEFLNHVRRIVVDFVVGRVLSQNGNSDTMSGLDNVTNYYLLHRYDYGMDDAPINAVILYAMSCSVSDSELMNQYNILQSGSSGSDVKLIPWHKRNHKNMGYQASSGRPIPQIDKAHRLLHLWKAGDVNKVNEYIDEQGVGRDTLFGQLLQALIELSPAGSEERALLESISNHLATSIGGQAQPRLFGDEIS
jgi:adenine-specific DNA methylase